MDSLQEVPAMLSRAGSFYYKNLSAEGNMVARKLAQLHTGCRVFSQLDAAGELAMSGGYINDSAVITFTDSDIDYYGAKEALQERPVTNELKIKSYTALTDNTDNKLLSEADREARITQVLAFPFIPENLLDSGEITVANRDSLTYGLYIDKDIFVSTITTDKGELLLNGADFVSFFGLILFKKNPAALFPKHKFVASSITKRHRNLLSFTLELDEVYGPAQKVIEYYRVSQNPKSFYYAAAQAIGMCVVPEDCTVVSVEPLHKGCAYITDKGKLDAPYNHIILQEGTELTRNTVIGGAELFSPVFAEDTLPEDLGNVSLNRLLPVDGLSAPNESIVISSNDKFNPEFVGEAAIRDKYIEFVKDRNGGNLPDCNVAEMNAIDYVRNYMAPRRCLILRINEGRLYRDMQLSLYRFIDRELPVGVVLLTENMINDF
jgi:hypothetical protein